MDGVPELTNDQKMVFPPVCTDGTQRVHGLFANQNEHQKNIGASDCVGIRHMQLWPNH
jgi:hypothetical protein